jgi:hypothetical protein
MYVVGHRLGMRCIYCLEATNGSEPEEHPVPEAVGGPFVLRRGDACGACNAYNARLDQAFCDQPHIAGMIVATGIQGKKKRVRSVLLDSKSARATIGCRTGDAEVRAASRLVRKGADGGLHISLPAPPAFNDWMFSRALHKIALGMVAHQFGANAALETIYDEVRGYIRKPRNRQVKPYLQRMNDIRTFTRRSLRTRLIEQSFRFHAFLGHFLGLFYINLVLDEFVVSLYGDISFIDEDDLEALVMKTGLSSEHRNTGHWILQPGGRGFPFVGRLVKPIGILG